MQNLTNTTKCHLVLSHYSLKTRINFVSVHVLHRKGVWAWVARLGPYFPPNLATLAAALCVARLGSEFPPNVAKAYQIGAGNLAPIWQPWDWGVKVFHGRRRRITL